jgi:membrane-bound serine protease (ClpP class)
MPLASLLLSMPAMAAHADPARTASGASVDVIQVQGVIDPAVAAYVRGSIERSASLGATVVLQIDSTGTFGDEAIRLGRLIRSSSVPIIAWVGPAGARAMGGALFLVYGSSLAAMAPGAGLGPARPFDLATRASRESAASVAQVRAALLALAPGAGARPDGVRQLIAGPAMAALSAERAGAIALVAQDLPHLLRQLDGRTVPTSRGSVVLATANRPGRPVVARFHELGPIRRVLHAVSTPAAVYVLVVVGLWALAFELTQPGFGVAGIAGLVFLALAGYGLAVVPVQWLGLALIVVGTALEGLDVLLKRVQILTLGGTGLFVLGSIVAWWGVAPTILPARWLIVVASIGGLLFFGFGMTVALKSRERIRTAQVGLVGLVGETRSDLDPEGGVLVKGALWRARSMDGRIAKGSRVRVRGIDGLILRVEEEPD